MIHMLAAKPEDVGHGTGAQHKTSSDRSPAHTKGGTFCKFYNFYLSVNFHVLDHLNHYGVTFIFYPLNFFFLVLYEVSI